MIPNSITVLNSKGGVGKTSLTSNLAGLAARSGVRTLVVDMDPQANMARYLGYRRRAENDKGLSLLEACVISSQAMVPRPLQARANLRVITAGLANTAELGTVLGVRRNSDPKAILAVHDAVGRLLEQEETDLVIFDSPPAANNLLADAAIAASNYVLLVSKSDDGSLDGFETFASQFQAIRNMVNPELEVLGAVLFAVNTRRTRRIKEVRAMLDADFAGTGFRLFNTFIRDSQEATEDALKFGELAHEYGSNAVQRKRSDDGTARKYSAAATKLATDYYELYEEILAEMTQRHEARLAMSEQVSSNEGATHV